ncbi:YjbH domain-containing protein [Shigella flexneri]
MSTNHALNSTWIRTEQSVNGPENFYMYQLGVMGTAEFVANGPSVDHRQPVCNLTTTTTTVTSPIRRRLALTARRTHVREYVQNDVYVNNLQANYFQHLGNGFYGKVYGGYIKTMLGGAGQKCCIVR